MYCPSKNQSKIVTFLTNGEIGEGKNDNENWKVVHNLSREEMQHSASAPTQVK